MVEQLESYALSDLSNYLYDNNNRLLKENTQEIAGSKISTNQYFYDNSGNQLSKTSETIGILDPQKSLELRLYIISSSNDDELAQNNGIKPITETEFNKYDVFNRLVKTSTGATTAIYKYKPDGLRLSKTVNGKITVHVWDGSNIVADLDNSFAMVDSYVRGINLIESSKNGFYVYNAHGDVVQLANASGVVTKNYHYDAFGVEESQVENDANPFRYCGEYFDRETGGVYLRARYYVAKLGRFLTEDPIKDGMNWYTYCYNNPVTFIDPFGLEGIILDYIQQKNIDRYGRDFNYSIRQDGKKSYVDLTIWW